MFKSWRKQGNSVGGYQEIVLTPGASQKNYLADIWRYRELFLVLAWRDIAVRYKQTVIGILWAILRPLLTMMVFTVVFGKLAHLPGDGLEPYPLLVFSGMLPWFLFSSILSDASNSLQTNASLVTKVYFPRLIIPLSATVVALVDFAINFFILLLIMTFYRFAPTFRILFVPAFAAYTLLIAFGPVMLLSALNVKYRDFRFLIPFIVQFGLYISPVGFSSGVVPEHFRLLYNLNPMVGAIDGFRWCVLGDESRMFVPGLISGTFVTAASLLFGWRYFRKTENSFADMI
jgi:lipopolysaccharide transport system permease protein